MEVRKPPPPFSVDEIRQRLKPMKLAAVARISGIPRNTLYRLVNGGNPLASTTEAISAFLRSHAAGEIVIDEDQTDG